MSSGNPHIGSSFDDWLKEEGIYEEATAHAIKCVLDYLTCRVTFSPEDGEFVGTCDQFPSLSHLDPDQDAALRGIKDLVGDVVSEWAG